MTDPASLYIAVVSIGKIVAQLPDRVEKSKTIEAIIKLYDSIDNLLSIDSKNLNIYELHEEIFDAETISIKLGRQNDLAIGEIRYLITGLEIGDAKIIFSSGTGDKCVKSSDVSVQVFAPLRLYPKNQTIIVGSQIQIYSDGGPHPDVNIIYKVANENIISMDSSIATAQKIGDTRVIGQCVGRNPVTGQQIVFSEDFVHIYVVPLDKLQIRTPLVRIKSGAIMPASIWALPDISPIILGTLPDLSIVWSTNQPDVISINGIFSDAGIEYLATDAISVRVRALNPGRAYIQAVIRSSAGRFTTSVEVTGNAIVFNEKVRGIL